MRKGFPFSAISFWSATSVSFSIAEKAHWKLEKTTTVTSASAGPRTGAFPTGTRWMVVEGLRGGASQGGGGGEALVSSPSTCRQGGQGAQGEGEASVAALSTAGVLEPRERQPTALREAKPTSKPSARAVAVWAFIQFSFFKGGGQPHPCPPVVRGGGKLARLAAHFLGGEAVALRKAASMTLEKASTD